MFNCHSHDTHHASSASPGTFHGVPHALPSHLMGCELVIGKIGQGDETNDSIPGYVVNVQRLMVFFNRC